MIPENSKNSTHAATFQDAMLAAGIEYSGQIIADGQLHRVKVNGDSDPNGWYVLHGDGLPAGMFGCWKRGIRETWCAKSDTELTPEERAERDRRWKQQQAERKAEDRRRADAAAAKAQEILSAAQPATDDYPYLKRKGVKAYPGVMVGSWPQRKADNCLLIPLRTAAGKLASVQAIFSEKRGDRDKDFLKGGSKKGAFFGIGDLAASDTILICEGYATGATLHKATGYAVAVAFDAGNLRSVAEAVKAAYPYPKQIVICGDSDRHTDGNPGRKAALAASKKAKVRVCLPAFADDDEGSDFNDMAALHGMDRVFFEVESALTGPWMAGKVGQPHDPAMMAETASAGRIGCIRVKAGEYPEAMDAAEQYLMGEQEIFQRGYLCRVSREPVPTVRGITRPAGTALMTPLTDAYLRTLLDRLIEWEKWDGRAEDWRRCSVPADIAKRMLDNAGCWKFPVLTGVLTAPTLRPDGSVLDVPGYDPATGLFFDAQGENFPNIPERPSRKDGQAALAYLTREILENRCVGSTENTGFSFATPSARAAALSGLLTPLVRHTVPTAPLHLISARRAGSGKSLLADAAALMATGKTATILDLADDDDEQEKRLLSVFLAGDLVINLDNIERPLGGAHLCKALTAETFTGRILGLSKNATVPTTAAWFATGNNVVVKEDMTRRVVLCLLDPQTETPERREYERNLLEWIPAHRPALVVAALTALRAYVVAGKPKQPVPPMGSFEDWHRLVRSALIWLGEADPLGDTSQMEDVDPTRQKLRALLFAWHGAFKAIPSTCKEAVYKANATTRDEYGCEIDADPILRDVLQENFADDRKGGISSRHLGEFISKNKGRIECGARFEAAGDRQRAICWRVKITDKARFDTLKSESSELGESLLLEREKLADADNAERSECVKNSASFPSKGENASPNSLDSLNSPDPRLPPTPVDATPTPPEQPDISPDTPRDNPQPPAKALSPLDHDILRYLSGVSATAPDEEIHRQTHKGTSGRTPAMTRIALHKLVAAGVVDKINGQYRLAGARS